MKPCDLLLENATLLPVTHHKDESVLDSAAIAISKGNIAWVGAKNQVPSDLIGDHTQRVDLNQKVITPGLVDCHTHLIYGGQRSQEFLLRLKGETYAQIAKKGGGIQFTVQKTREASEEELYQSAKQRLTQMLSQGVTTVEIKSGYGLDLKTERKILQIALKLEKNYPITIQKTFLGAHALPVEYRNNKGAYIDYVADTVLPELAKEKLVDAVDGFCEKIAFSTLEIQKVFDQANALDLRVKLHAEQLSDSGGAILAAKNHALSADHLEYLTEEGARALKTAGTVAVLLPGAYYYLKETQKPPLEYLRAFDIPMAIATDCNPGSSPTCSLLLMLNMACILFGLTPFEALCGVTCVGAKALGLDHLTGSLAVGKWADLAIWDIQDPLQLVSEFGTNPCVAVIKKGQCVYGKI